MISGYTSSNDAMAEPDSQDTAGARPEPGRAYSPDDPYGVKGEWIRHDLLDMVPQQQPRRALSIGCGTAATESILQRQGTEVWGLDVSTDAVALARTRISHADTADIEVDPLPELRPGHFDLVLCGDVLEHLRFPEHVLDRIHGWLADDGHLVIAVPNATHHSVVRTLVLRRDWKYEDGGLFDRGHYRLFTRKSLLRLLGEHGFQVEQVSSTRPLSGKVRLFHLLLRPLFWLIPSLDEYLVYTWIVRVRKVPGPDATRAIGARTESNTGPR
ncbi:MAG: class I SAM-dependent methyltransferase [Planctomycetes bacterium]|nr:class I SAM-dependent methyltransferase [Planctomycetota bacterium]